MSSKGAAPMDKRRTRFSRASKDPGAAKPTKNGESKMKPKPLPPKPLNRRMSRISKESVKKMAVLQVADKWSPPRKLTDNELQRARQMFYELDADGSGSIDAEELGVAMRQLGQQPTETELRELIFSVDEGDMDGKLQFREFCKLFALGIDTKGAATLSDATDCYAAMGGDTRDEDSRVEAAKVEENLLAEFGLAVNVNEVFGVPAGELSKQDMERMVLKTREGRPAAPARGVTYA